MQSLNVSFQSKKKNYLFILQDCRKKLFVVITRSFMDQCPVSIFCIPPSESFFAFKHYLNPLSIFIFFQTIPNFSRRFSLKQFVDLDLFNYLLNLTLFIVISKTTEGLRQSLYDLLTVSFEMVIWSSDLAHFCCSPVIVVTACLWLYRSGISLSFWHVMQKAILSRRRDKA